MTYLLMQFNLIAVPLYCFYRLRKNSYLTLLNPCFYLLLLSYIYLTVSSAFIRSFLEIDIYYTNYLETLFKANSIETTNLLCNWYTLVFFIFFVISTDYKIIVINFKPKTLSYQIALILASLTSLVLLIITIIYGPTLIATSNRGEALTIFAEEVFVKYRIGNLVMIMLGSIAVLVWRNKNFKWYLLLLIPIALELLSKGRTISLICIIFAYINYVTITQKTILSKIGLLCLGLIATGLWRSSFDFSWSEVLYRSLAEVVFSRVTTTIVYDNFLSYGNLGDYLIESSVGFLPPFLSNLFIDTDIETYTFILSDLYYSGTGFTLAGNIVSEALFYGGLTFAIISPLIIGSIFYGLHKLQIHKTFPGFIFFCFLIANLQRIMRTSFYDNFLTFVYLMTSYLVWITLIEWGRIVLVDVKSLYLYYTNPNQSHF